jgi:threonine aldolase
MASFKRRDFLRAGSLAAVPFLTPFTSIGSPPSLSKEEFPKVVDFTFDGVFLSPLEYAQKLQEIAEHRSMGRDFYGRGGIVKELEEKMADLTGKESALFMPSGTMANEFSLRILSGNKTKVFVQETSHIYRDEGDAAQAVHNKRLIPVAKGKAAITLEEIKAAIDYHNGGEVFKSGIGAISIEVPVRRCDAQLVDIQEIQKISEFARANNIKMHLDGARIHLAAAYSGISVKEYSSYFDTVYISLYKYLGATGGAILCGDKAVIDQMPHLMKVFGGTVFGAWPYAAVALHYLEGFEDRFQKAIQQSKDLFKQLNQLSGITIKPVPNGTYIHHLLLDKGINHPKLSGHLSEKNNIEIYSRPEPAGHITLRLTETLLHQSNEQIVKAFKAALAVAQ